MKNFDYTFYLHLFKKNPPIMKKTKNLMMAAALLIAVSILVSFNVKKRQEEPIAGMATTVADWERAKAYSLEYLNASTDVVINYKPTPEMRTFGQQMLHLAEVNYNLAAAASGKTSPVAFGALEKSDKLNTKEAVTKEVMASYDFVIAAAKELTEPKMSEMIKVFNFDLTRGATMEKVFEHQTHHRGQTTVYLRLKGITPPQEKLF
jgi:uncharacterized damage-inducible protein DinB